MKYNELINCPICSSNLVKNLINIDCGNFDNSTLYRSAKICVCENCGHVYNRLFPDEIAGLVKYYNDEYAPANIGSSDKTGDRPGSNNQNTIGRYGQLYSMLGYNINSDSRVLDVGCAMGGFLDHLYEKGLKDLSGIDLTEKYVSYAKQKGRYNIKLGSAEAIPFNENSFDILVIDQVMEHLAEPRKAFIEAKRVLVDGGLFCIGVPDASRYGENFFFDFYWFIMREHIQHFDIEHLKLLAEQECFELVSFSRSETPMMSEKMILPNLNAVFKLTGKAKKVSSTATCFNLKKEIERYIAGDLEKTKEKKRIIDEMSESGKPVYAWGIGREFLYLYENAGLKNCNIKGLIDTNNHKQGNCMIDGKRIVDQTVLDKAASGSVLMITAIAHADSIKTLINESGYRCRIVEI